MVRGYEFPPQNRPLSKEERQSVLATAEDERSVVETVTRFGLYSGMKPHWASHVTGEIVQPTSAGVKIVLPPGEQECQCGGHGGPNNDWSKNREPCQACGEDGHFKFPTPRVVPIRDDRTARIISDWFGLHDSLPNQVTTRNLVSTVGEKAGVPRLSPVVLRHSFGVLLAGKGFSRNQIRRVMGFAESSMDSSAYVFFTYGRLCEGSNPFVCGAETATGERCQHSVKQEGTERCMQHRDSSRCSAQLDDGRQCGQVASNEDDRCVHHTDVD